MMEEKIFKMTEGQSVKIDLGCGGSKRPGYLGIDILPLEGVDYVVDLEKGLPFIPDNVVDEYYTSHFLEHVENLSLILGEMYRTLKSNGTIHIVVPHHSNPYYYSDYTHKRFFGLYTFHYFAGRNHKFKRNVPQYGDVFKCRIERINLVFRAPHFPVINLLKKHIVQRIFNLSPRMQEFYEGFFTKVFSCYEIHYFLKVDKE
jgi:predicted SAM-dependent methyltransferase